MVFVIDFSGVSVYFVASLLEMSEWGETNATSLKQAIDNIFSDKGQLPLKSYETKLVAATAD